MHAQDQVHGRDFDGVGQSGGDFVRVSNMCVLYVAYLCLFMREFSMVSLFKFFLHLIKNDPRN